MTVQAPDVLAPEAISRTPAGERSRALVSTRLIFGIVALYFCLHVLFRVLASGTIELDESEQALLAQDFRWGYGVQPPLYTWLQTGFFILFGQTVFALSLLKHLLLFATFILIYATARIISQDERTGWLAMLSLLFVPQFAWESHRDLTHSVAATTFAAATLFAMVRLLKYRRLFDYVLLGACAGLGVLAKYNFAIFLIALLLATLVVKEFRAAFANRATFAAVAAFILVTSGHFTWLLQHGTSPGTRDLARTHLAAIVSWGTAVLSFGAFLFVAMAVLRVTTGPSLDDGFSSLIRRTLIVALGLSFVIVIVWKARFKDRWFQPILFALPLYFALWARPRLSARGTRLVFSLAAAVAIVTLLLVPAIPLAARLTNRPTRLNLPYSALGAALRKDGVMPAGIAADSRLTGGNLKLHFPKATVTVPELRRPLPSHGELLVIWEAKRKGEPPKALPGLVEGLGLSRDDLARASYVELPMQFMAKEKTRWAYVVRR